ncbi:MAG: hypothetical protein V1733_07320 [bacterium]
MVNVKGPTKYACGGYIWEVKFSLAKPSPKGGYIIQEISTKRKATINCPKVYKDIDITFYEAWKVNAGKSVSYYIQNNPKTLAGELPSTLTKPAGWDDAKTFGGWIRPIPEFTGPYFKIA